MLCPSFFALKILSGEWRKSDFLKVISKLRPSIENAFMIAIIRTVNVLEII